MGDMDHSTEDGSKSDDEGTVGTNALEAERRTVLAAALRESELRLHNLADNLSNALVYQATVDPDGSRRFTYLSRGVERLNELSAEEVMADASLIYRQFLPESAQLVRDREEEALKNLTTLHVEVRSLLPSGRLRWFEFTSTPRRLPDGLLVWDGVEVDITERKQVEEELERRVKARTEELTAANERLQAEIAERSKVQDLLLESEERYRSLFVDSRDANTIVSPDRGFLAANPAAIELFACTDEQDFTSHTPASLSPEFQPDGVRSTDKAQEMMGLALANGSHFFEWMHRRADGTEFPATIMLSRFEHRAERLLMSTVRDVTVSKQAEKRLKDSEARYRALFDQAVDGIAFLSVDGESLLVNEAFAKMHGYDTPQEMEHLRLLEVDTPETAQLAPERLRRLLDGEAMAFEVEHYRKDGSTFPLHVSCNVIEFDGRKYFLGFHQDITERKQTEAALRELQRQYQAVVEGQTEVICRLSPDGRLLFVNDTFCRFLGLAKEELLGKVWTPRAHPEDVERVQSELGRLSPKNPVVVVENRVRSEEGMLRWIQFINRGFFDTDGKLLEIQAVGRDVTERKYAEDRLKESEERYRGIFDESVVAIFVLDKDKSFINANEAGLELIGYSREELLGMHIAQVDAEPDDTLDAQRTVLSGRRITNYEHRLRRKNGTVVEALNNSRPLMDSFGNVAGILTTLIDITDLKRAEAERRSFEDQMRHTQKLESLGVMAGGIAHDFNNILHIILANAHHSQKVVPEVSAARPFVDNIERAANRAAVLTRQMLAYSGRGRFLCQELDMGELVREITHLVRSSVSKKVTLQTKLSGDLAFIEADAAQIQQVLMNLVLNATEALDEEHGGLVTVSAAALHCTEDYLRGSRALFTPPAGEYVCVEVSDTGCGMGEETVDRRFDPFFTTKFTGRGLGMSAVLGIVRGHRGAIMVDSAVGKGTTVRVLFPASVKAAHAVPEGVPESHAAAAQKAHTILFVDDEPDMLEIGAFMLEDMGYSVVTATGGMEAVEALCVRGGDVDCAVLDLSMPHMDGAQTLLELRRIKPDIRAILTSGYAQEDLEARLAGQKVDAVMTKPYDFSALSLKLREILS
jgi:PAS domain S-box-containing protein